MTLLLTGSDETVHGILGAMRYVTTAGATRPFEGPSADMIIALAGTFDSARTDLSVGDRIIDADGGWSMGDHALSELCTALPDARARHEAMVASTLCILMADELDPAGEEALDELAHGFGVDEEAADVIRSITESSATVAGGDLFRRFLAERSDDSLEVITGRLERLEAPLSTPPEEFDAYHRQLQGAPEGSVGAELLRFYQHTGYDIPGNPAVPGLPPLSVLGNHDLHHVLAGYSTSGSDEVNVAAFTAANSADGGIYYLAVVLMQWHHSVKVSPFEPAHATLDPEMLATALARGATSTFDVSDRSWEWKSVIGENLEEVRGELGITPGGTVAIGGAWDARGSGNA